MKKENNTNLVSVKDRFLKAIAYLKGNMIIKYDKDIVETLKIYKSNFSKAKKGDPEYLTESFIEKFCDEYGFNKDWLLTDTGEMLTTSEETEGAKISYNPSEGRPFYPVDWTLGLEEDIIDDELFYPEFNIDFHPANKEGINWYTASGNSMIGEIDAGSYIAMEEIHDFSWFPLGQIYGIVTTNGMRTIKKVVASNNKDCYLLKSSNPDKENYPDQDIPKKMIKRVFRVLWVIRKLD